MRSHPVLFLAVLLVAVFQVEGSPYGSLADPVEPRAPSRTLVAQCSECPDDIDVFCEPHEAGGVACVRYGDNMRSLYRRYAGDFGDACDVGNTCKWANTTCSGGICVACGGTGEPCCASDTCSEFNTCSSGTCESCGGRAQSCCPTGTSCQGTDMCSSGMGNTCRECGLPDESCCADNTCLAGAECYIRVCKFCGLIGYPCCLIKTPECSFGTCNIGTRKCENS
ncbi:hypothetical protein DFJ74DRAFT_689355 [Hyaloraphidium curvatum]|nr:hypothetical protein DFJ74DRAFT_689355 [Hyaloraphidium curvatum]